MCRRAVIAPAHELGDWHVFGGSFFFRLGEIGKGGLGQEQGACHGHRVFEGDPNDLCRVDDAGLNEVYKLTAGRVRQSAMPYRCAPTGMGKQFP